MLLCFNLYYYYSLRTGKVKSCSILPMHGSLPYSEQLRVFQSTAPDVRKIVVATNIAETSITIPGIVYGGFLLTIFSMWCCFYFGLRISLLLAFLYLLFTPSLQLLTADSSSCGFTAHQAPMRLTSQKDWLLCLSQRHRHSKEQAGQGELVQGKYSGEIFVEDTKWKFVAPSNAQLFFFEGLYFQENFIWKTSTCLPSFQHFRKLLSLVHISRHVALFLLRNMSYLVSVAVPRDIL